MKKTYILLLLLLACTTLKSQIILETPHSGAQTYDIAAPEYVRMKNNFEYKPVGTNYFHAYIDPNAPSVLPIVYGTPVDPENRPIDTNFTVGTTPGQAGVSLTGGATYTIPIFSSPGTAGMQPSLSLVYNSQGGNGIAGYGWNIAGLSAITRVGHTIYHNGAVKGVDFIDDRFALDGQRLINTIGENGVVGEYGADGTAYYTEVFNGSKIITHGTTGAGPEWFEVIVKDGSTVEYGKVDNARQTSQRSDQSTITWYINKITDPNGNYMSFFYNKMPLEINLKEIQYTGNQSTNPQIAPYNSIKLYYSERTDISNAYIAGSRMEQTVLLDHIDIVAEKEIIKTYILKYYFNLYSKLNEIIEYGKNNEKFNSTVFGYGTEQETVTFEAISGLSSTEAVDVFPGDFNGDGYSDLLAAPYVYISINGVQKKSHTSFKVYLKYPNPANNIYVLSNTTATLPPGCSIINKKNIPHSYNFIANDVNGDGQADVTIVQTSLQSYGYKLESLNYYLSSSNGTVFTLLTPPRVPQQNYYKIKNGNYIFSGDFDGNGIDDVLTILGTPNGSSDTYFPLICFGNQTGSCGSVFISGTYHFDVSTWQDMDNIYIQDFDGDGKSDIMLIKDSNCEIFSFISSSQVIEIYYSVFPTKYHLIQFGDFNGDGKTDILCRTDPTNIYSPWEIDVFTGTSFLSTPFTFSHTPNITGTYSDDKLLIADLNSDGLADIYHEWSYFVNGVSTSSKIDLYYKKTGGFDYKQISDPNSLGYNPPIALDINGDGRIEILDQQAYYNPIQIKYFGKESKSNLLERIKNGTNFYTKFSYKRLTEPGGFYTRTAITAYPVNTIQVPFYLVNQMQSEDGIGGFAAVSYTYKDALLHKQGKGFLGFKEIETTSSVSPIYSVTKSEVDPTYYFMYPVESKSFRYVGNMQEQLISKSTFTKGIKTNYEPAIKVFLPYQPLVTSYDYVSGAKNLNESSIDQWGNPTSNQTSVFSSHSATAPIFYSISTPSNYVNAGAWCPSKPQDIQTIQKRTDLPSFVKNNHIEYDANGNVTKMIDYKGLPKEVTTVFSDPTPAGQMRKVVVSANDVTSRESKMVFEEKYRFVVSSTNAEGLVSSATYDPAFGNKLTITDANELTSTSYYDGFGSAVKKTDPLGVWAGIKLKWYTGTAKPNILYYSESTSNNGLTSVKYYDRLGRVLYTADTDPIGMVSCTKTVYNAKGQLVSISEPYFEGTSPSQFSTNTYHPDYGFLQTTTLPAGVIITNTNPTPENPGNTSTTANSITGITTSKTVDATGKVISATDPGGTIAYTYFSDGSPKSITAPDGSVVSITYDAYGRQETLTDPDAGLITYTYNAFGELQKQVDAKGNTFEMLYDKLGRLREKKSTKVNETTILKNVYYQATDAKGSRGALDYTEYIDEDSKTSKYTYLYNFNSLLQQKTIQTDRIFTYFYTYDDKGNLNEYTYPSGYTIVHEYYPNNGALKKVKDKITGNTIYAPGSFNARGQMNHYGIANGTIYTSTEYDPYGLPTYVKTGKFYPGATDIQYLETNFDAQTGNLNYRKDRNCEVNGQDLAEYFTYDPVHRNRLATWQVTGQQQYSMTYADNNGNILTKSDLTSANNPYIYSKIDAGPHAVTGITAPLQLPADALQRVTYNPFNKVKQVFNNLGYMLSIEYGPDEQRIKSEFYTPSGTASVLTKTKYFIGDDYEVEISPNGTESHLHYLPGGGLYVSDKNEAKIVMYYVLTDYQGNWYKVINEAEAPIEQYNFDAWGKRRNATNWSYTGVPTTFMFDRGYTGHEMLDAFGLINMNGRVYDPIIARFLSPDNYIQTPDNSQGFNRYSYCLNNPLKFTDPSGEFFVIDSWVVGLFSGGWDEANKRAGNDAKIWGGLFASDPNKSFGGRIWEVVSRFTWQLPQTIVGWGTAQSYNTFGLGGGVESVKYKYGATVVKTRGEWGGVTQGSYIVGDRDIEADANNSLFQHEYGHYIQSQSMGWAYYPRVGIPSIRSNLSSGKWHDFHPVEQDANRRAFLYFNKNVEGFYDTNPSDNRGWDFDYNPIDPYQTGNYGLVWDYKNAEDLQAIDKLTVHAKWYDHFSWLLFPVGPIGIGLINSGYYNRNY